LELCETDLEKLITNKIKTKNSGGKKEYFSESEIKKVLFQCMKGLAHLKKFKINHRDIKPNNILVKKKDSLDYGVVLSDFNLSKKLETDYANLSSKYGCPTFVAPEINIH